MSSQKTIGGMRNIRAGSGNKAAMRRIYKASKSRPAGRLFKVKQ
jgi:hypothetical protein